jgi:Ca2+-binding EF-hand superfamily protein
VESEKFIEEVAGAIDQDRAYNYDKSKFKELFERFDDNKDWLLSKGEMAQFIKFAFRKSDATLAKDKAKANKVN